MPVTKEEEKDSVSNGELRVRGMGDDGMVEGWRRLVVSAV